MTAWAALSAAPPTPGTERQTFGIASGASRVGAIQNSDKTTTYYDRMGRFIGSSRD